MNKLKHDIEIEKQFLDLLGYEVEKRNNSNRFNIFDGDNKIGFIQYGKSIYDYYGYHMYINNEYIKYDNQRALKESNDNRYDYLFYVKRDDDTYENYVQMNISKFPSLIINSLKYGSIILFVDSRGLYLNFRSEHDDFFTEESLVYCNSKDEGKNDYAYQIRYWDKDKGINYNDRDRTTIEIAINNNYNNNRNVCERIWIKGKLVNKINSETESSIEEFMINHGYGIECFNRFREFINKILPFKKDVIPFILTDEVINDYNLDILFKKYNKEKNSSLKMTLNSDKKW